MRLKPKDLFASVLVAVVVVSYVGYLVLGGDAVRQGSPWHGGCWAAARVRGVRGAVERGTA